MYECKHCMMAPRNGQWSRNWKWQTERGYNNHKCYIIELDRQAAKLDELRKKYADKERGESLFAEWLSLKLTDKQIGDEVFFVRCDVILPTKELQGLRFVKVRDNEERSYYACKGFVTGFHPLNGESLSISELEQAIKERTIYPYIYIVGKRRVSMLLPSYAIAVDKACIEQESWDGYVKEM